MSRRFHTSPKEESSIDVDALICELICRSRLYGWPYQKSVEDITACCLNGSIVFVGYCVSFAKFFDISSQFLDCQGWVNAPIRLEFLRFGKEVPNSRSEVVDGDYSGTRHG